MDMHTHSDSSGNVSRRGPVKTIGRLVFAGFLLVTLIMFPILVFVYIRLAQTEERWALNEFGDVYRRYCAATPRFIPHFGRPKAEART